MQKTFRVWDFGAEGLVIRVAWGEQELKRELQNVPRDPKQTQPGSEVEGRIATLTHQTLLFCRFKKTKP